MSDSDSGYDRYLGAARNSLDGPADLLNNIHMTDLPDVV
jgi:hypothetical protein